MAAKNINAKMVEWGFYLTSTNLKYKNQEPVATLYFHSEVKDRHYIYSVFQKMQTELKMHWCCFHRTSSFVARTEVIKRITNDTIRDFENFK
jgi:acetate kinase